MRKILSVFLLISLFSGMLMAANNREFRATWSITWHQYSGSLSAEALQARTRDILDKHVEAGMNAVLWHVRQGGTAYYPSAIEPWGSYLGYSDPGYDPLEYAVEEAHKRGLELHAWFNTFAASSTIEGAPAQVHPEWVCRDGYDHAMGSHRALSPGLKAVRDYTVNLAAEIVNNYDIDGIHFDYVRWNEYDNSEASILFAQYAEENDLPDGVLPPGMEEYLQRREADVRSMNAPMENTASNRYIFDINHPESGGIPDSTDLYPNATDSVKFASWADWRRGATNVFIKAVHDTVQTMKPWVKVSPAALGRYKVAGWNGYYTVFQDAARWFNEGWVDLLTPMNYHWLSGVELYSHLLSDWGPNIIEGVAAGRFYSAGPPSYLLSGWAPHKDIVEKNRTIPWVQGFQFFSYGNWKDSKYAEESSHTVFASTTKHPSYPFLNNTVPPAPAVNWVKHNDTSYTLTINPDGSVSELQWFVIYRAKDAGIDVDTDEIMKIIYADSTFDYEITFDGLQQNDDKYYYAASMCSRYWIESPLSSVVSTDILSTKPPVVVSHIPSAGAIDVPNNQVVELTFNKSMDPASIAEHLSIDSEVSNLGLSWDNPTWVKDDHLVLNIFASWQFNETYTVTLGDSTTDQVGLRIDGNGDGTAGDAFLLSFTISGADEEAPIIINSTPIANAVNVDTDAPFSFMFDELVDHGSLSDKFTFYYAGYMIYPSYSAFDAADNRTHVTVKTNSLLASAEVITLDMEEGIADTAGNTMANTSISFTSDSSYYVSRQNIDNFTGTYAWYQPGYSGSTYGINDSESSTAFVTNNYVPGFGADKQALRIICTPDSTNWFARIHSADLRNTANLDTTKIMQTYVFGDGSGYQFRFCMNERSSASGNSFEVSSWYTVDWIGWKLIEWDIHDPLQFGEWGGMTGGSLDGTSYGYESIQLKPGEEHPEDKVTFYIDQLRMVDKVEGVPEPNLPPVVEAMPDTSTMSDEAIYLYASFSDPNPNDVLTFTAIPDTSAIRIRHYSSPAGKMRIRPEDDYIGISTIMLIATDNGVGELSDTAYFDLTVTFNTAVTAIPEEFTVYPNYPNPFNPVTTLRFDLPHSEQVMIEIYNTRGQRVAILANQQFEAGSYSLHFDGAALSSGVYFYKITAGEHVSVNRMTLLK